MTSPPRTLQSLPTQLPFVGVADVLEAPGACVIDLRSPGEFAQDHVPGAVNVPLLDDVERAVVGTLYKQVSPDAAFERGRGLIAERIEGLVRRIAEICVERGLPEPSVSGARERVLDWTSEGFEGFRDKLHPEPATELPRHAVVLHCWRGGMRSMSVIALMRALGITTAVGLEGGYKAYRRHVLDQLERWTAPRTSVLRGLTGVGKSLVLREIEALRPGWTLDLEACAGHRSSLLGKVGLEPVSQKTFESRIARRLREAHAEDGPREVTLIEGESRKVGDVIVPGSIWSAMCGASNLLLEADVPRRTQVLRDDYLATADSKRELREQLAQVEPRMNPPAELVRMFDEGRIDELVAILLEHYYDPLYRHSEKGRAISARFDASDERATARAIVEFIEAESCPHES